VRKEQQQAVHRLEKAIQDLERRQAEITAELEKPETYQAGGKAMDLNREFKHNADEIGELTAKWEEAASRLDTVESA
jgi:ATP-binding cassette subfamily F protein 3